MGYESTATEYQDGMGNLARTPQSKANATKKITHLDNESKKREKQILIYQVIKAWQHAAKYQQQTNNT